MRAIGAAMIAMMCICAGARAQELTISGSVVSSDGKPLSMAFVNLDSSKIICQVDFTGHYLLVVPASLVHGQPEKLQAMARGHIHTHAPVTLVGTSIVRDFVLQVDTMPEHRRIHPMLSDGRTEKSATDITITGRVTDSAGAAMRTADVRLQPEGFPALTDDSGFYSIRVPARMQGQKVVLSARFMGYQAGTDSVRITGEVTTRDFVMFKSIYSEKAKPLDRQTIRAAGLTDLRNGPHRKNEREIRIRMDNGYFSSSLVRLVNRSGKTSGELISFIAPRDDEDSSTDTARSDRQLHECTSGTGLVLPCRVRFAREPDWLRLWSSLDSLDIWNIVDEGSLRKRWSIVLDGSHITAELWDGHSYKAWAYATGVEDDGPGRAKVSAISHLLRDIDSPAGP